MGGRASSAAERLAVTPPAASGVLILMWSILVTLTRRPMRLRLLLAAIAAVSLAACLDTLEPPNGRFGIITVETYGPDDPNYVVAPRAEFYGATNRAFGTFPADSCVVGAYTANPVSSGFLTLLGAGDAISMSLSGQTRSLLPDTLNGLIVYRFDGVTGLAHTPGDTLTLTIPGANQGFPGATIKVRTAEPFTHSTIPVPSSGVDINVTWDPPAAVPGSLMSFSLQYANAFSAGGTFANEQVFCAFTDDGTGTIPWGYLGGWRTSVGDFREVRARRLRFSTQMLDGRTELAVVATFTRPLGSYIGPAPSGSPLAP